MEYIKNIAKIEIDEDKCTGCCICTNVCPHGVINIFEGKAVLAYKDRCIECGACDLNCPFSAIKVESGVGCASALINTWITNKFKKSSNSNSKCC